LFLLFSPLLLSCSICKTLFLFCFYIFFPILLCWVRVHCGILIYKGSYNVSNKSYLNLSLPPLFHFFPGKLGISPKYTACIPHQDFTLFTCFSQIIISHYNLSHSLPHFLGAHSVESSQNPFKLYKFSYVFLFSFILFSLLKYLYSL
jgi:hypothetical protein